MQLVEDYDRIAQALTEADKNYLNVSQKTDIRRKYGNVELWANKFVNLTESRCILRRIEPEMFLDAIIDDSFQSYLDSVGLVMSNNTHTLANLFLPDLEKGSPLQRLDAMQKIDGVYHPVRSKTWREEYKDIHANEEQLFQKAKEGVLDLINDIPNYPLYGRLAWKWAWYGSKYVDITLNGFSSKDADSFYRRFITILQRESEKRTRGDSRFLF